MPNELDSKQKVLDWYIKCEHENGRDRAIQTLKNNIHYRDGDKRRWRQEILREYFGVYDEVASAAPTHWDEQLAALLGPTTPIYIQE